MTPLAAGLSEHLIATGHSATLALNQKSQALAAQNHDIYRFGFGQSPFPVPHHIVDALRSAAANKAYAPVQGLPCLRESAAHFHGTLADTPWREDRVIIGAGSKILLFALLAALRNADVAVVAPGWVSYAPQARLAGHAVHYLPSRAVDHWRLQPETLRTFCESRDNAERPVVLILNYPGNPSGTSYTQDELTALVPILREHNVCVVSDEIYGLLHHRGEHFSLATLYPEGTIVSTGLSKWCGAGGWRLGLVHVPEALGPEYFDAVIGVCSETFSCASTPIQYAATAAYEDQSQTLDYLSQQRAVLSRLGASCAQMLEAADIETAFPEGGFYLFPDFGRHREKLAKCDILDSGTLCQRLLEEAGVALLPGTEFGMPQQELTARLAYVDFDGSPILDGNTPDVSRVLTGVEAINDWVTQL